MLVEIWRCWPIKSTISGRIGGSVCVWGLDLCGLVLTETKRDQHRKLVPYLCKPVLHCCMQVGCQIRSADHVWEERKRRLYSELPP